MQARRFWPPTKHKLLYANLVVYGITIILLIVFHSELIWAQKALRGFLFTGDIPPSADRLLIAEAIRSAKEAKDPKHIQHLFEQAVQIEPYSEARLMLGYCYLRQGEYDKMLACFERYRSINPCVTAVYVHMSEILEKKQDRKAINQLLTEGIKHFRRHVELYQPHYDPNVPKAFNLKAFKVYSDSREGLNLLKKMQEELNDSN